MNYNGNGNGAKAQTFMLELLKMALAVAIGTSSALVWAYNTFETRDSHDRDIEYVQRELDIRLQR